MKSRLSSLPVLDKAFLDRFKSNFKQVEADSRKVQLGDIFLACRGEYSDGRDFIAEAISNGVCCVLWDDADNFVWNPNWKIENYPVKNLREQSGIIAAYLLGNPSEKMLLIGVTGTNGKTSIASWLAQTFNFLQREVALIGTTGNGFYGALIPSSHTTPAPVVLQQFLAEYRRSGAQVVSIEVSSHALDQSRVNGVDFDCAIFTNLTRDHLDYHKDLQEYGEVKRRLFHWQSLKHALINIDDVFGRDIAKRLEKEGLVQVTTYGIEQGDVRATICSSSLNGLELNIISPWGEGHLSSPLLGRFNVYNLLACLATLCVNGVNFADALQALAQVKPALGRMQCLGGGRYPLVVVDYAHTPDALEKTLSTLRQIKPANSQLYCVFGCGGDRDKGKRQLMGKIADELADVLIISSDNPRSEDAAAILQDILLGVGAGRDSSELKLEIDRRLAINFAIQQAKAGDVVLIAGKGHEDYQEINQVRQPFSDVQVAKAALDDWNMNHG